MGAPLGAVFRQLNKRGMRRQAAAHMQTLGIRVQSIRQTVDTLSGGQRQAVALARAAAWGRKVVIFDEPTAALGVRETSQVLELIRRVRDQGLSVVLISYSMPEVFAIADRIHIHRLGHRLAGLARLAVDRTCDAQRRLQRLWHSLFLPVIVPTDSAEAELTGPREVRHELKSWRWRRRRTPLPFQRNRAALNQAGSHNWSISDRRECGQSILMREPGRRLNLVGQNPYDSSMSMLG